MKAITRYMLLTYIVLFGYYLTACSAVTPATVELSNQASERITTLRDYHIEAVNKYYDNQIAEINTFVDQTWTPLFLRNFLGMSNVLEDIKNASRVSSNLKNEINGAIKLYLDDPAESERFVEKLDSSLTTSRGHEVSIVANVVNDFVPDNQTASATSHVMALLGTDEPGQLIIEFAEDAEQQINDFRNELVEPVDKNRRDELALINQAYGDIIRAQNIITARLDAEMKKDNATRGIYEAVLGEDRAKELFEKGKEFTSKTADIGLCLQKLDKTADLKEWAPELKSCFSKVASNKTSETQDNPTN